MGKATGGLVQTAVLSHCGTWVFFESSVINLIFSYYLLSLVLNRHNDDKATGRYLQCYRQSGYESQIH